jgi:putative peptidoglycan lipid II flippase
MTLHIKKSKNKLIHSTIIVSSMTMLSRVFGLIRDVVFARFFGVSVVMDAFIVANRIPNMLRRFFAEGAFNQGFIPVIADYKEKHNHAEVKLLVDSVAGTFGLILFIVSLIGVIMAPILVSIVAPGFIMDDGRFDLATLMLRFTFPYLMFISLTAFAGGILNTYGKFSVPAFTPVILNITLILAVIFVAPELTSPGLALAYAVFIAGIIQLIFQLPFLSKINLIPRPRWRIGHEGIRRIGKLMAPAIFGSSVAQINILVSGIIASMLGIGKISLLYYSDRIMELPLSLFGIALATVTMPFLSRQYAQKSMDKFASVIDWSMRLVFLFVVPAAIGIFLLAEPMIAVIYYGGMFDQTNVEMTALSLRAFAIGLIGFSFVKILSPAYFAREDTKTPVKIGLICLSLNLVLGVSFAYYLTQLNFPGAHAGLALAISIAALLNALLLYIGLRKNKILQAGKNWFNFLLKIFIANLAMFFCLSYTQKPLYWWLSLGLSDRLISLLFTIIISMLVYFTVLFLSGIKLDSLRFKSN